MGIKGEIIENEHVYQVDGEIGRFKFATHRIEYLGEQIYNSSKDLFHQLIGKQWYNTRGFKELAFVYGSVEGSYRKTRELINRVRYQANATPLRTLQEKTEAEGENVALMMEEKTKAILIANSMSEQAVPIKEGKLYGIKAPLLMPLQEVVEAIKECAKTEQEIAEIKANPVAYEDSNKSVNICIDDVVVKEQKESRVSKSKSKEQKADKPNKERKYVHNTVAHLAKGKAKYLFNGYGVVTVLRMVIAFLLNNQLLDNNLVFFLDGQKTLHEAILKIFSCFRNIKLILDWYHLDKKCKELLSMALTGRKVRNSVLEKLIPILWQGRVDSAIAYLQSIDSACIKNTDYIDKLIGYLQRNYHYIPCYSVRKQLNLCNSSNRGEKENDLIVSQRQKHNSMSWSKHGSIALASLTTLKRNKEVNQWFKSHYIDFKLAA